MDDLSTKNVTSTKKQHQHFLHFFSAHCSVEDLLTKSITSARYLIFACPQGWGPKFQHKFRGVFPGVKSPAHCSTIEGIHTILRAIGTLPKMIWFVRGIRHLVVCEEVFWPVFSHYAKNLGLNWKNFKIGLPEFLWDMSFLLLLNNGWKGPYPRAQLSWFVSGIQCMRGVFLHFQRLSLICAYSKGSDCVGFL